MQPASNQYTSGHQCMLLSLLKAAETAHAGGLIHPALAKHLCAPSCPRCMHLEQLLNMQNPAVFDWSHQ